MGDSDCPTSDKLRYCSRAAALAALMAVADHFGLVLDPSLHAYECPTGDHWHPGRAWHPDQVGGTLSEARAELGVPPSELLRAGELSPRVLVALDAN